MADFQVRAMQQDADSKGQLQINVTSALGATPISGAKIAIYYTGEPERELEEVTTNESGQTEELELDAPPLEYSVEPSEQQPYSEYTMEVTAPGYEPVEVVGAEILPDVKIKDGTIGIIAHGMKLHLPMLQTYYIFKKWESLKTQ